MTPIKNCVMFSEMQFISQGDNQKLNEMVDRAIKKGLEGLMIKDIMGVYEPGKRHWLKIKKDYLLEGSMADCADLIVLGAYYGTGNKGGTMSVFLMGCYDTTKNKFCTVTKCGNGHDDATLDRINKELKRKVVKISKDYERLPKWLLCNRQLVPDFVVKDPTDAPVWEISGAEFTSSDAHTANGISIRFPRVTKIRDDKTWDTATNLNELKTLYEKSKEKIVFHDDSLSSPDNEPSSSSKCISKSPGKRKKSSCGETEPPSSSKKMNDVKVLFDSMVFFLPGDLKSRFQVIRQIAYFGGDVTDSIEDATHVVSTHAMKRNENKIAAEVSVDWIKECIKQARLLPML